MTLSHSIGLTCWEQGCGKAFLSDSLRSPRPRDLLGLPTGFESEESWLSVYKNERASCPTLIDYTMFWIL